MNKKEYIDYANKNFKGSTRKLLINQINKFYDYKDNFKILLYKQKGQTKH